MPAHKRRLVELLAERAYEEGDFVLSSGKRSNFYLNAKLVTYDPDAVEAVGESVLAIVREYGAQAVGGPTLGADAMVASTVWASRATEHPLAGFIVRKEAKAYGRSKQIEGVVPAAGTPVAILDDVATTGGSILLAVDAAREAGLEVVVVVPLVDRGEGGEEAVSKAGIPYWPVCTLDEIRAASGKRHAPV